MSELWIFGYGSLVWKSDDFKYEKKCPGFIKGFYRKFYQNSIDHRGTVDKPGRVVTLVPADKNDDKAKVFGMAYKIADQDVDEVLSHLDHREKNGYTRANIKFYPYPYENGTTTTSTNPIDITVYVATPDNPSYAGNKNDLNDIANQILTSRGISGENKDYVYKLADSMRIYFPNEQDDHLFALEKILRQLDL